jgi:pimeloyl-ACP methyl ester carboxylesterase
VLLDGDAAQWRQWCQNAGWHFLGPWTDIPEQSIDLRIKALEKRIAEAAGSLPYDENRVYLAGQGEGAAAALYTASRAPDLWAAAVAVGGAVRPVVDSNRLFGANTANLPVLWLSGLKGDEALARRMKAAGYNLEFRVEPSANAGAIFEWLARRRRDPFPALADCETGVRLFSRCYWIELTGFDPASRNDALGSTRVPPIGTGAALDLGGFGFTPGDPGPGVRVSWLPPGYRGPLNLDDRIVAIAGKPVRDADEYAGLMDKTVEEKPVAVTVQRGRDRIRLESRIIVPPREETVTARVQGRYFPELQEIQVMSRAVKEMRLTVPAAWAPASLNWNGTDLGKADAPGCWLLEEKQALLSARKCP